MCGFAVGYGPQKALGLSWQEVTRDRERYAGKGSCWALLKRLCTPGDIALSNSRHGPGDVLFDPDSSLSLLVSAILEFPETYPDPWLS